MSEGTENEGKMEKRTRDAFQMDDDDGKCKHNPLSLSLVQF